MTEIKRKRKPGPGRPPSGPFKSKHATITTRVTTETYERLKAEAAAEARSLSQWIEMRLTHDRADRLDELVEQFGGSEAFALLLLAARLSVWASAGTGRHWLHDRYLFDLVRKHWDLLLDQMTPPGDAAEAPVGFAGFFERFGTLEDFARVGVDSYLDEVLRAPDLRPVQGEPNEKGGEDSTASKTWSDRPSRKISGPS